MAVQPKGNDPERHVWEDVVLVTPAAEDRLDPSQIWHHLGGCSDEGDTYETQEHQFTEDLEEFWLQLVGPDEHLRVRIMEGVAALEPNWQSVSISADGTVTIVFHDGSNKTLRRPKSAQ